MPNHAQTTDLMTHVVEAIRAAAAARTTPEPIDFAPSPAALDTHTYKIDGVSTSSRFPDARVQQALRSSNPHADIAVLSQSAHWEDRIRAAAISAALNRELTLPDGFPCIYEPADSPAKAGRLRREPYAWVASPDEDMLRELLPLYRELWAAYDNQWPHSPNRSFEFGHLDGISPHAVYRPGATPTYVIGTTMLVHDGMYALAPEHLREMHPLHAQWEASKAQQRAKFHAHVI